MPTPALYPASPQNPERTTQHSSHLKVWFRWISVFPAGLIGSYAVNVFLNLLAKLFVLIAPSHLLMGTSMFAVGRTWFTSMLVGAAFVLCGSYTAPRARTIVAFSLAAFQLITSVILLWVPSLRMTGMLLVGVVSLNVGGVTSALIVVLAHRRTQPSDEYRA